MATWHSSDYHALVAAAGAIGARPLDLLLVLDAESGLDPRAIARVNGAPYALGLNQITPPNAKAMGLSDGAWEQIPSLSVQEQLPLVVRSFKAAVGARRFQDAGELYMANFAPGILLRKGAKSSVVLYDKGPPYEANAPLDEEKKGFITVGDLRRRLLRNAQGARYKAHAARLRELFPGAEGPVIEAPMPLAAKLGFVGLGVGALVAIASAFWFGIEKLKSLPPKR